MARTSDFESDHVSSNLAASTNNNLRTERTKTRNCGDNYGGRGRVVMHWIVNPGHARSNRAGRTNLNRSPLSMNLKLKRITSAGVKSRRSWFNSNQVHQFMKRRLNGKDSRF